MFKFLKLIPYIIIAFLLLRVAYLNKQNENLKGKTTELSEQLKSQTTITKEKIVYKYRDSEGKPKQETIYLPSEGQVNIITPKDEETLKPSKKDNFFNSYFHVCVYLLCLNNTLLQQKSQALNVVFFTTLISL